MKQLTIRIVLLVGILTASFVFANEAYVTQLTPECSIVSAGTPKGYKLSCKTYHQTTDYTCGPAAVMMLMNYYHKMGAGQLNKQTELRIASEMGASKANGGASSSQIESWLSNQGFSVSSGNGVSTDFIIESIQAGHPVIIGYNHHWILAKGFNKGADPENDQIIFADSCCNVSVMSRKLIDEMGQDARMPQNHCQGNVGQYIVATP